MILLPDLSPKNYVLTMQRNKRQIVGDACVHRYLRVAFEYQRTKSRREYVECATCHVKFETTEIFKEKSNAKI
jgi:hypothetical protein